MAESADILPYRLALAETSFDIVRVCANIDTRTCTLAQRCFSYYFAIHNGAIQFFVFVDRGHSPGFPSPIEYRISIHVGVYTRFPVRRRT